ncbi:MAG: response regulator [Bdellovibrionota bacterium]
MENKAILIVDDSDFERNTLSKALSEKGGFTIIQANGGDSCFELIKTNKVDVILMDIMMPGVYGNQILLKIREQFNAIELPIIMVTAKTEPSDIIECLQNGANDYIIKPVNFEVAISRILTHLKLADTSREMSRLKEIEALNALISKYNHEINNPLTIALGCLGESMLKKEGSVEKLKTALWRIANIVKKIESVSEAK